MRAVTEAQIRACFVNASDRELAQLPMPGLHETLWDEREYLGWRDSKAVRLGYIVLWVDDRLVGLVVRSAAGGLRPGISAMCALCHAMQPSTQVRMFSAQLAPSAGSEGSSVGTYLCEALNCSYNIRSGPAHLTHPARVASRGQGVLQRLTAFAARVEAGADR